MLFYFFPLTLSPLFPVSPLKTYIGDALNLLTLVTIGVVLLFSLPKIYEANKQQIDASVEQIMAQIQAQLPVYKVGSDEISRPSNGTSIQVDAACTVRTVRSK